MPFLSRGRPVGRRSNQRMPEPHLEAELHQVRLHRRCRCVNRDTQPAGRSPQQHRITRRIGRRQLDQPSGLDRQGVQLPSEAVLDPARQWRRIGQAESSCQLGRRQRPRQLEQRQRVAVRLGDDQIAHPGVQRPGQRGVQQRPRIVVPQPLDLEFGQPGQFLSGNPGREHQADRISSQPTRNEPQRLHRSAIEPLLVVDDADQRPLPRNLGQETQHGQTDQEPVRRRAGVDAERGAQRIVLRTRQSVEVVEQRCAELVQTRERQLHLRLHAHRTSHPAPLCPVDQVVQQHGLAHAGVAVHHQCPALTVANRLDQAVEHVAFPTPVRQPGRTPSKPEVRRHPTGSMPLRCGRPHPVDGAAARRRRPGRQTRCERSSGLPRRFRPRLREAGTCHERLSTIRVGSAARTNSQESARPATGPPVASARAPGKSSRPWAQ